MWQSTIYSLGLLLGLWQEPTSITELVECYGDKEVCIELIAEVSELLPEHIEQRLASTVGRIEIVTDKAEFLQHMSQKVEAHEEIIKKEQEYVGLCTYGYEFKTVVYSIADRYVLLHELGHAYDYSQYYLNEPAISGTDAWVDAYNTEYVTTRAMANTKEYFAETFAKYFHYEHGLEMFAPTAHELMEQIVEGE